MSSPPRRPARDEDSEWDALRSMAHRSTRPQNECERGVGWVEDDESQGRGGGDDDTIAIAIIAVPSRRRSRASQPTRHLRERVEVERARRRLRLEQRLVLDGGGGGEHVALGCPVVDEAHALDARLLAAAVADVARLGAEALAALEAEEAVVARPGRGADGTNIVSPAAHCEHGRPLPPTPLDRRIQTARVTGRLSASARRVWQSEHMNISMSLSACVSRDSCRARCAFSSSSRSCDVTALRTAGRQHATSGIAYLVVSKLL